MVNYCIVYGCGNNNKINSHLIFFCLPKSKDRQEQWLRAAGRGDLLGKTKYSRICSRHFHPSQIKKRHLLPDSIPTLYLPDSLIYEREPEKHNGLICNSCSESIIGYRYKCLQCHDYDLCQKCEMHENHPHHLMLRINRPMKFSSADNLVRKWHDIIKAEKRKAGCDSDSDFDNGYLSSDDEPITKYAKTDSCVDISEDVKTRIRKEISRVLKSVEKNGYKRTVAMPQGRASKRARGNASGKQTEDSDDNVTGVQELAFADVGVECDKVVKCESGDADAPFTLQQDKDFCVVLGSDFPQLIS